MGPNSIQRQPGSKSVLGASRARFSSILGFILGLPNRSKNGTKNELILGPGAGGAQGGKVTPGDANVAPLGARGETTEGGT